MSKDGDAESEWSADVVRFESGVMAARLSTSSRARRAVKDARRLTAVEYVARSALADVGAAFTASFFVAVPVSIIDRAIVQSVAGTVPLGRGLKLGVYKTLAEPIKTITHKSFLMVLGVYLATYATANTFESFIAMPASYDDVEERFAIEKGLNSEAETRRLQTLNFAKFLSVTAANMSSAVAKDRAFARMYGTVAPSRLPLVSWGCWVARDLLTIGCAFTLPKPLAAFLSDAKREGGPLLSPQVAGIASQLVPVMAVQVLSTPLHLMANDFYNFKSGEKRVVNPSTGALVSGAKTTGERIQLLVREGPKSFVARLCRIAPAFGFGGIGNGRVRERLRKAMDLN